MSASERVRQIAWLGLGRAGGSSPYVDALRAGLHDLGWVEGRNATLSLHWAGREDMEAVARQVAASNPDVIVTQELMVFPVQRLKAARPIVFGFSGDAIDGKLVESLAKPGGNLTGMTYLATDLVGKRIELLKEWLPQVRRIAVLARPQHPGEHRERQASEEVVKKLGMEMIYFPIPYVPERDVAEFDKTLAATVQANCDALVVFPDAGMLAVSGRIAQFAAGARLPSVSGWTPFAQNGFLLTYGPDLRALYRSLARYVDRILRGAKPADLPVELPAKFEFAINLKTAQALGLEVPPTLFARADEVIE
jgi:putative tryptophan/tyrosine transport system substrate-binding protein